MAALLQKKRLIVIAGPTASGKTALSIELARSLATDIISADSRQIYKEMKIGTGPPSDEQLAAVPHHFIQTHSIFSDFSAGDFEKEGVEKTIELFRKYDTLILCGGSGLYLDAFCNGFDELPLAQEGERERLDALFREKGIKALQDLLKEKDPEYYDLVDRQNPQRLIRALEICSSGKKYSESRKGIRKERPFTAEWFILDPPREKLYAAINQRVDLMIASGWPDEARMLFPHRHVNALQTLGYSELFEHISGKTTLLEAVEKIKSSTRNYAKRQITWLRRKEGLRFASSGAETIQRILDLCR